MPYRDKAKLLLQLAACEQSLAFHRERLESCLAAGNTPHAESARRFIKEYELLRERLKGQLETAIVLKGIARRAQNRFDTPRQGSGLKPAR
jgi:hypothetical protein